MRFSYVLFREVLSGYDVIVVGGGHAGCEAAAASARMGCKTLLMTHKKDTVGEMSCNPAFGGIGKGHLMREVDALDGLCCRISDLSGIYFSVLNRSRGPAVWGLRAQIDRQLYKMHMQEEIANTPNLTTLECAVEDMVVSEPSTSRFSEAESQRKVVSILTGDSKEYTAKAIVITTGTFLGGELYIGKEVKAGGRIGESASFGLSKTFKNLGFRLQRLRTGTPPRLSAESINFEELECLEPDKTPIPFSFLNTTVAIDPKQQVRTYLTMSVPQIEPLVRETMHENLNAESGVGSPRYCPSLEAKVLKFPGREFQVFLEPEGLNSNIVYPNGMSMAMRPDVQEQIVRLFPGLSKAKILQYGYGVHYDCVDARQLKSTLETKSVDGLFLAGQINGTTGYEEAAAQGVLAGINAGCLVKEISPLGLTRMDSYTGVMVDDLTSLGTNEPYRMFTSRAEFRIRLRPDNADLRLTPLGIEKGCVSERRISSFRKKNDDFEKLLTTLRGHKIGRTEWAQKVKTQTEPNYVQSEDNSEKNNSSTALKFLGGHHQASLDLIVSAYPDVYKEIADNAVDLCDLGLKLKAEAVYSPLYAAQDMDVERLQKESGLLIPLDLDYSDPGLNLCRESREKLSLHRPENFHAASRIGGVSQASLLQLFNYIQRVTKSKASEKLKMVHRE